MNQKQLRNLKIDIGRFCTRLATSAKRGQVILSCPRGGAAKVSKLLLTDHRVSCVVLSDTRLQVVRVECPECGEGYIFHPSGQYRLCGCGLRECK